MLRIKVYFCLHIFFLVAFYNKLPEYMKLLDPFAGYRLASGHPFFHVALFIGSFIVSPDIFLDEIGPVDDAF